MARIRRYRDEIGLLLWAAPHDWMCEPWITAKTGLTVEQHQQRTVANYAQLRKLAPDLNIIPVVQGDTPNAYLRCVDLYRSMVGVDLTTTTLVGVGSICRRQGTEEAGRILTALHSVRVHRLHGFGFKVLGPRRYADLLTSADSMAWSVTARRQPPLPVRGAAMSGVLQLRGASKTYLDGTDEVHALRQVHLAVDPGPDAGRAVETA